MRTAISIREDGTTPLHDRTTVAKGSLKVERFLDLMITTTPTASTIITTLHLPILNRMTAGNPLPPLDPNLTRSKLKNPPLPLHDSTNPNIVLPGMRRKRSWMKKKNTPLQLLNLCMVLTSLGLVSRESTSFPSSLNDQRTDSQLRGSIQKRSQPLFDAGTPRSPRTHED